MATQKDPWEEQQLSLFSLPGADDASNGESQVYENEEEALEEIMDRRSGGEEDGGEPRISESAPWQPEAAPCGEEEGKNSVPVMTAEAVPAPKKTASFLSPRVLRRAALAFLSSEKPDGLAAGVYIPALRAPADAVSFSLSGSSVSETRLALAAPAADRLAMSAGKREQLDRLIREQELLKESLEETIRKTEPGLNASLFPETAEWEYEKSRNAKYHRCLRKLEKLRRERQYSGKLDRLLSERTADELFLILPEGADCRSVPDGWGIVFLTPGLTLKEVRPAGKTGSESEQRAALAAAAAVAARENVLFANGIRLLDDGTPILTPIPRRRPSAK